MKARQDLEGLGDISVCTNSSGGEGGSKFIASPFLKLPSKRGNVVLKRVQRHLKQWFSRLGNTTDPLA